MSSLTSAEELPYAPTTDEDSDLNFDTEVVWVKSARGVWGMGHSFGNKLYFTRDIPEGKWVPKDLLAPAKPPTKKAKPPPKSAAQSIPMESGEHVQEFKVNWSSTKKFYCLRQVHLAEHLPQATHTLNRVQLHKYRPKHVLHILDGHFR